MVLGTRRPTRLRSALKKLTSHWGRQAGKPPQDGVTRLWGGREAVGASERSVSNFAKGWRGQKELGEKKHLDLGFAGEIFSIRTREEGPSGMSEGT